MRRIYLLAATIAWAHGAFADDITAPIVPKRPAIKFNRWQEDWSVLADPALRTEPFDELKYMPLAPGDPKSYVSLGLTLRERVESTQIAPFGVGNPHTNTYVIQRLDPYVDIRPDANWQIFVQLYDDRAWNKDIITPVDKDPLDVEQAFIAYTDELAGGTLKLRAGRQQMAFDLQRFVGVRDGPNVRQSFDAVWADWEQGPWRYIGFWSHPVQNVPDKTFNDFSNTGFQYGGLRVERNDVGSGSLSAYYSQFNKNGAQYLDGSGDERRHNLDVRYVHARGQFAWDFEVMGQTGRVGSERIRALAVGSVAGYTFEDSPWSPTIGLQFDFATGDRRPGDGTIGTFNPLFPNAYYFTLAGNATYANLVHVRPFLQLRPQENLNLIARVGLQWRQTTQDAVYVIPNKPVPGTAGQPGRWTGVYEQLRAEWQINRNWAAAFEGVQYQVGDAIRRAGGINANYFSLQLSFGW